MIPASGDRISRPDIDSDDGAQTARTEPVVAFATNGSINDTDSVNNNFRGTRAEHRHSRSSLQAWRDAREKQSRPPGATESIDDEPTDSRVSKLGALGARVASIYNWIAVRASRDPRWVKSQDWRVTEAGGFQIPARVCPRKCTEEVARRELVTRTSLWGQARVRVRYAFETEICPDCGSRLIEHCGRCKAKIVAPVSARCRSCGLPQPWSPERRLSATRTRPQRWNEDARNPATLIHKSSRKDELLMIDGDITNIAVDGIVSNDDVDGRMYTVIASSIKAIAGPDVERESISGGPYPPGEAWYTDPGSLPAQTKGIVHVAAMDRRGNSDAATIVTCVRSALVEARKQRLTSLAIAAFGTGPRGPGPKLIGIWEWLTAVSEAIVAHFDSLPGEDDAPPLAVLLVLYEPRNFDLTVKSLKDVVEGMQKHKPANHLAQSLPTEIQHFPNETA